MTKKLFVSLFALLTLTYQLQDMQAMVRKKSQVTLTISVLGNDQDAMEVKIAYGDFIRPIKIIPRSPQTETYPIEYDNNAMFIEDACLILCLNRTKEPLHFPFKFERTQANLIVIYNYPSNTVSVLQKFI